MIKDIAYAYLYWSWKSHLLVVKLCMRYINTWRVNGWLPYMQWLGILKQYFTKFIRHIPFVHKRAGTWYPGVSYVNNSSNRQGIESVRITVPWTLIHFWVWNMEWTVRFNALQKLSLCYTAVCNVCKYCLTTETVEKDMKVDLKVSIGLWLKFTGQWPSDMHNANICGGIICLKETTNSSVLSKLKTIHWLWYTSCQVPSIIWCNTVQLYIISSSELLLIGLKRTIHH